MTLFVMKIIKIDPDRILGDFTLFFNIKINPIEKI